MIDFNDAPGPGANGGKPFKTRFSYEPPQMRPAGYKPPYFDSLNDRQREAVLATDGPLIVLAGAGSGKTKMLTSRIAYLMDVKGVPGHQILAVTFTNKAAREMRERVEKTLGLPPSEQAGWMSFGGYGQPEIGTFHSVCTRILRREAQVTPYTKPFVIYDDSDQLSLVKGAVEKLAIDPKSFNPKSFQGAINRLKCDAVEPQEMNPPTHDIYQRKLKQVYEQYQKDLYANNAIDFGEIITMAYRVLRDHPEVRAKYQQRFRFIHVDEYQDTNRAQYLLLSQLAGKTTGGHTNICVVGDEDQSIYKWRGADINNILDFEKDYPGAKVVKLEQNYRSTKTIITAASHVIKNNTQRKDKTLWTANEEGLPILRVQLPDERAEAEMVVSEIKREARDEGRTYGEFAILYRTHAQSRQFEEILMREKIPYKVVGGLRFYDRKEIKDVLSYLKVLLNPNDSISLKRIINVPARGIGKTTLDKIDELALQMERNAEPGASFWAALQRASQDPAVTSAGTMKKLATFVGFLERLMRDQPKLMLSELYHLILDETQYVAELKKEGTDEAAARIENLEEFDTSLVEFEEDFFDALPEGLTEEERDARRIELLPMFLEQASLASEVDSKKKEPVENALSMMTLHSSKGLEFPVVFLPGMEEGLFPSVRAWEETSDDEIEEERRLCYVGMTRARSRLYLSNVIVRRLWGNVSYQEPARFFAEMPADLIEFRDLSHGSGAARFKTGSSRQFGFSTTSSSKSSDDDFSQLPDYDDDVDQTPRVPQPSVSFSPNFTSQASSNLKGRHVHHPEYGNGVIIASDGSGENTKVTIEFSQRREQKKFVLKFIAGYLR